MDGTWAKICEALRIDCDLEEGEDWTLGVDSTVVRAHQHAAGARHELPKELSEQAGDAKRGGRYRAYRVIVKRSAGRGAG
ncbi:hypothetical protein GCM10009681_10490 [Luedemannella helvata]|uniref:Transposase n=1 Tax=Luedemannella helvata TaxID=349315 RepID=A0ABN2JX38_9ACTN